ncbi:hypothetical protein TNCV_2803611 [Trichonephila clavipes]|nr:hypothetical protein TNCV_2803611 [Trichonephila clavipes]
MSSSSSVTEDQPYGAGVLNLFFCWAAYISQPFYAGSNIRINGKGGGEMLKIKGSVQSNGPLKKALKVEYRGGFNACEICRDKVLPLVWMSPNAVYKLEGEVESIVKSRNYIGKHSRKAIGGAVRELARVRRSLLNTRIPLKVRLPGEDEMFFVSWEWIVEVRQVSVFLRHFLKQHETRGRRVVGSSPNAIEDLPSGKGRGTLDLSRLNAIPLMWCGS